jgi:ribonuclease Y
MQYLHIIITALVVWWIGRYLGKQSFPKFFAQQKDILEKELQRLRLQKETEEITAKTISKKIIEEAEYKANELIKRNEKDLEHQQKKIDQYEHRLAEKESKIDTKYEQLDQKKEVLLQRQIELDKIYEEQQIILEKVAWLTAQNAKIELFQQIEEKEQAEIERFVNKMKQIKEEDAQEEAAKIIAKVIPRVAQEGLSEHLLTLVDLPTEDMKGKIIWREWRNISAFERVTWVEVTIDDTPLTIKLSGFDPEKRFLAAETMRKLIKDAKINPASIEKYYEETISKINEAFMRKGKETLTLLNLPMMKPEIVEYIGRFHLRYSYGQNLLSHSIEVARMAEMLANEMGLNADLAKKAWLLHDIWKIDSTSGEWHAKIGADILRKHGMHDIIVNTAEGHHFDVPLLYPESRIATAADIISASRPGARVDSKERFIERMTGLETLVSSITWVQKSYIMQAGREIMAFFNPEDVSDQQVQELVEEIGIKIEQQMDYPGQIRIIGIREHKITHFVR